MTKRYGMDLHERYDLTKRWKDVSRADQERKRQEVSKQRDARLKEMRNVIRFEEDIRCQRN